MASFSEVYKQAEADYFNENDAHRPIDPEIRFLDSGQWEFVSSMLPAEDAVVIVSLADFHGYFWEAYGFSYVPSKEDEEAFLDSIDDEYDAWEEFEEGDLQ